MQQFFWLLLFCAIQGWTKKHFLVEVTDEDKPGAESGEDYSELRKISDCSQKKAVTGVCKAALKRWTYSVSKSNKN